jgi:hypothetical protein
MDLASLVVVVIAKKRLKVLPAIESADSNAFLRCDAGLGILA